MVTKLDLVNHLLSVVGERKALTLNTGNPSVIQAVQALDGYNNDFQGKGWWFNKNKGITLVPTIEGEILIPTECLSISIALASLQYSNVREKTRYVRRDGKIYDNILNTFNIGYALSVDMVVLLDIEDLPSNAQTYLKHYAAAEYYLDDDGDTAKKDRLDQRTMMAWHTLKAEQMRVESTNVNDSPSVQVMDYRIGQMQGFNPIPVR